MTTELTIKKDLENKNNNFSILKMEDIPKFDMQEYDIFNEKDAKKYIADIEKTIRSSMEYRELVKYLHDYMDMNKCIFFENINNIDTYKIKIHLHHTPFTLFDIVTAVFNKRLFYQESTEVEMVAKECMKLHYYLMVGLVPLSETSHELVHSQSLFIPLDNRILGNYREFVEEYKDFIDQEAMDRYNIQLSMTETYNEMANLSILSQNPIAIEMNDSSLVLPNMNSMLGLMNNRIETIKSNNYQIPMDNKYDNNVIDQELVRPIRYSN